MNAGLPLVVMPQAASTGSAGEPVCNAIVCPACGARYERPVRKAARDPGFTAGFSREIQLVAMDMLVHHLLAEHELAGPAQAGE